MAILVTSIAPYLQWCGLDVHMHKSLISTCDHATGLMVATDSITSHGKAFTVLPPDQPHKYLGVRATLLGDFSSEKEHVLLKQRIAALSKNEILSC